MILAGDIGGTKVHLAIFEDTAKKAIVRQKLFASHDFKDFSSLLATFLTSFPGFDLKRACFGVAGAVVDGVCKTTNLPWVMKESELKEQLGIEGVKLINDLEANAWGLRCLTPKEFAILNEGKVLEGNQVLISAGTGLGEAGIYWDGSAHQPFSSEGGHCDFAPLNEEEMDLWRYLRKVKEHVSYEEILSGNGIFQVYQFLVNTGRGQKREDVMGAEVPQKMITELALLGKCPVCVHALEIFSSVYGAEAGNLALKMLAVGGVFIGGGIAPKIVPMLEKGAFMKAFTAKGRFSPLLAKMPVKIVLNDNTALLGAAVHAQTH